MSAGEFTTIVGAISGLVVAVTALYVQVRVTHKLVNSRMDQLLALTQKSAHAEGALSEAQNPSVPRQDGI